MELPGHDWESLTHFALLCGIPFEWRLVAPPMNDGSNQLLLLEKMCASTHLKKFGIGYRPKGSDEKSDDLAPYLLPGLSRCPKKWRELFVHANDQQPPVVEPLPDLFKATVFPSAPTKSEAQQWYGSFLEGVHYDFPDSHPPRKLVLPPSNWRQQALSQQHSAAFRETKFHMMHRDATEFDKNREKRQAVELRAMQRRKAQAAQGKKTICRRGYGLKKKIRKKDKRKAKRAAERAAAAEES